jgi:RNA polymerase sigma factor (sigma-70 family)
MSNRKELKVLKEGLRGPILRVEDPREHDLLDILKSYFREILMLARKYTRPTVDYEDLVVEGLIGLMDAVQRWDPEKSTGPKSFHQLAIIRIKSQMFEFFLANNTIYTIPNYMARAMALVDQIRNLVDSYEYQGDAQEALLNFEARGFEKGVPKEFAEQVRRLKERIQNLAQNSKRTYEEMVQGVLKVEQDIESFEREGELEISPEEASAQREFLDKLLGGLNPAARHVIALRLEGCTLEEVGSKMGFTRERARQIQDDALRFFLKTRMFKDANA